MAHTDYYLKTGDPNLDRILAMDEKDSTLADKAKHGILVKAGQDGAPVVLILGGAGTGKTTLALQFATEVATRRERANAENCRVFFYSLEQSVTSLRSAHANFGFWADAELEDLSQPELGGIEQGVIHLCHFAPLPISTTESAHAFEDRFKQLCHMIEKVSKAIGPKLKPVFFIDSLNAIATSELPRSAIYRLFTLFRSQDIPVIITAERSERARNDGTSISEDARFLADVVMELTSEESVSHYLTYLQIGKSRIRRQVLGKHLYKIRTVAAAKDGQAVVKSRWDGEQPNCGFLVYPSLPSIVSMARDAATPECTRDYYIGGAKPNDSSIRNLMGGAEMPDEDIKVKCGACFSLVGPAGTHKLALGLNLATGDFASPSPPHLRCAGRMLIISFGSYTAVDLSRVAWFQERKSWSKFDAPAGPLKPKWNSVEYKRLKGAETAKVRPPQAAQLMFRMGHLTPEECFYGIQSEIEKKEKSPETCYSSVLVWDTAQIRTGFPLLRTEPLFLPSLVDFFREKKLVSVFIGVKEEDGLDREMDSALESAADYRMSLSHYPTPYDLAKGVFAPNSADQQGYLGSMPELEEQLTSVVVDNVTGKHYGRHPIWLIVKSHDRANKEKTLECLETKECAAELRRSRAARQREWEKALRS